MSAISFQPVAPVIQQHVEEAAILRNTRSVLVAAPPVKLRDLRRLDDRIAAHLDGLAIAAGYGWKLCEAALETPGAGEVFTATVRAIEDRNAQGLDKLFALAETAPASRPGLISAFGWVTAQHLQGTTKTLLSSSNAFRRETGIAACAMHQVDPGATLDTAINDADASLRARGLRVAGERGRSDLLGVCVLALTDDDVASRFSAANSAVLLGDRGRALSVLKSIALDAGSHRARALQILLKIVDLPKAQNLLKALMTDGANIRLVIQGIGIAGDPYYVPWLIKQMDDLRLSRLAGESFSFITGLDLAYLDLEGKPPENFEGGPNDDPADTNVDMDADDGLPWPDPEKIKAGWSANKNRFENGVRYFMGAPVTREHCVTILKEGYQRQRIAAAQYLCLLNPGTPLFNTAAPAWRQQRWLAKMT